MISAIQFKQIKDEICSLLKGLTEKEMFNDFIFSNEIPTEQMQYWEYKLSIIDEDITSSIGRVCGYFRANETNMQNKECDINTFFEINSAISDEFYYIDSQQVSLHKLLDSLTCLEELTKIKYGISIEVNAYINHESKWLREVCKENLFIIHIDEENREYMQISCMSNVKYEYRCTRHINDNTADVLRLPFDKIKYFKNYEKIENKSKTDVVKESKIKINNFETRRGSIMSVDVYTRLKYEFNGIRAVIKNYSSEGNIANFLDGLEKGIDEGSREKILYFLNEICLWYQQNIGEIETNQYVYNFDDHKRNKEMIEKLNEQLKEYDFSSLKGSSNKAYNEVESKIFISHRSSDKKYGDALRNLICGLGVKNNQLVYTSHPLHKIPLDADIYDFLRSNINNKVLVIILWSNEYLESPACLNEMGAAWVVQTDYTNIYTPDFSFGNSKYHQCAVDQRKMGALLNGDAHCKASMIEFRDKIKDMFDINVDDQTWTYLLDEFITQIQ